MTTKKYRAKIFFEDECPRLGAGWRRVNVAVGRKWVRLTDDRGVTARITKAQLDVLRPMEIPPL